MLRSSQHLKYRELNFYIKIVNTFDFIYTFKPHTELCESIYIYNIVEKIVFPTHRLRRTTILALSF